MDMKNDLTAPKWLQAAADTMNQRAKDRDQPQERSMAKIVAIFNLKHGTNLTEAQGWNFMATLKEVRALIGDNFRGDDYIDHLAYLALEAECRAQQ